MKKTTIIITLIICLNFINCKSSSNNNENNSPNRVAIKKINPKYDNYSAKQISQMSYKESLLTGFSYYNNMQYTLSLPFLKKACAYKKGEAYYHLGNSLLRLRKYKQAISTYKKAYYQRYSDQKTLFKIASAYSLSGDPENALLPLLSLLSSSKRSKYIKRIKTHSNLINFRISKYYKKYLDLLEFCSPGIIPKTKADFMNNMLFGEAEDDPNYIKPSFGYHYRKNGIFHTFPVQANAPQQFLPGVGTWVIDQKEEKIIIRHYEDTLNYTEQMYKKVLGIKTIADFKKANFPKIHTSEILFKNMRLNIKSIYADLILGTYSRCETVILKSYETDNSPLSFGRFISTIKQ